MYAFAPGQGPFWPAGEIDSDGSSVELTIEAKDPSALERLVRAERRVWLGKVAAMPAEGGSASVSGPPSAEQVPLSQTCAGYLDWYQLDPE
jgi:hypothetical protein